MLADSDRQMSSDPVGLSPTAVEFGAGDVGWQALGPAIVLTVASSVVVALRWYTRCKLVRCVGFDDYIILLSLVCIPLFQTQCCFALGPFECTESFHAS